MTSQPVVPQDQLGLFQSGPSVDDRLARDLKAADLNRITPLEALNLLAELKKNLEE
jgi:hypothetical protein